VKILRYGVKLIDIPFIQARNSNIEALNKFECSKFKTVEQSNRAIASTEWRSVIASPQGVAIPSFEIATSLTLLAMTIKRRTTHNDNTFRTFDIWIL